MTEEVFVLSKYFPVVRVYMYHTTICNVYFDKVTF